MKFYTVCPRALAKRPIITNSVPHWNSVSLYSLQCTRMTNGAEMQRKSKRVVGIKKKKKTLSNTHTRNHLTLSFMSAHFNNNLSFCYECSFCFWFVLWFNESIRICMARGIFPSKCLRPSSSLFLPHFLNRSLCIFILYRFGCSFFNTQTNTLRWLYEAKASVFMTFFPFYFLLL